MSHFHLDEHAEWRVASSGADYLRAEAPTVGRVARWTRDVYLEGRRAGESRPTAVAFSALHAIQRVSYYLEWGAAARSLRDAESAHRPR